MDSQVQRVEMVDSEAVPVDIKEEIDIDDSVYWNVKREFMSDIDQQKLEQQVPPSSGAGGSLVEKGIQEKQTERTGYLECVKKEQEHGERYEEEEDVDDPDQCKASCSKAIGQFQIDENKEMICTIKEEDTFQEEIVPIPFVKLIRLELLEGECQRVLLKRDGDTVKQVQRGEMVDTEAVPVDIKEEIDIDDSVYWNVKREFISDIDQQKLEQQVPPSSGAGGSLVEKGIQEKLTERTGYLECVKKEQEHGERYEEEEDVDDPDQCKASCSKAIGQFQIDGNKKMICTIKEEDTFHEDMCSQRDVSTSTSEAEVMDCGYYEVEEEEEEEDVSTLTEKQQQQWKVCSKRFSRSSTLNTHMRTHTDHRPYQCTVCTKTFTQSSNLNRHMHTHTDERPYQCIVCTKTFTQSSNLNRHMHTHTDERPYQCTVCTKTFSRSSTLNTHMRTHTDHRPYQCTVCTKTFTQSSNLNRHMHTHTDEKPYQCIVCTKTFTQSSNLNRHMHTHTDERPYQCTVCTKTFSRSSTLNTHMRTHTDHRPYHCKVCTKSFSKSSNLNRHIRTHTGESRL